MITQCIFCEVFSTFIINTILYIFRHVRNNLKWFVKVSINGPLTQYDSDHHKTLSHVNTFINFQATHSEMKSLMARKSHLSGCFWLFAPKFWEVVGTYKLSFCPKRNAASVVLTMWGGRDTQTLLDGKKWTLNTCRWWRCKNFPIFSSSC